MTHNYRKQVLLASPMLAGFQVLSFVGHPIRSRGGSASMSSHCQNDPQTSTLLSKRSKPINKSEDHCFYVGSPCQAFSDFE